LITSIDAEDRTLKLAIGPLPRTGQSMSDGGTDRGPASAGHAQGAEEHDGVFYQKPPTDEIDGELSVEGQRDYASLAIRIDQSVQETNMREQGVLELWETLSERQSLIAATPNIRPSHGWFTSKFGYRISPFTNRPVMHNGLDIAAPPGSPIIAPADGVVSFAGYDAGYGKLVSIDHGYGVVTRYGHTSQIFVEVGQRVKRRDVIAAVGTTGRSTGPHVHYEVRVNNVPVDPMNYLLDE
jgi:murein DD-endopeptidase MepM/ murein hydrolase activator NlpD